MSTIGCDEGYIHSIHISTHRHLLFECLLSVE